MTKYTCEASTAVQTANPLHEIPEAHTGAGSGTGCSTLDSASCLWPGRKAEDSPRLWDPTPTGDL